MFVVYWRTGLETEFLLGKQSTTVLEFPFHPVLTGTGRDGGKDCSQPLDLSHRDLSHTRLHWIYMGTYTHIGPRVTCAAITIPYFSHVRSFCWSGHKLSRLPTINRLTQKTQEFYQSRAGEATRVSTEIACCPGHGEDLTEANGARPASKYLQVTEAEL